MYKVYGNSKIKGWDKIDVTPDKERISGKYEGARDILKELLEVK